MKLVQAVPGLISAALLIGLVAPAHGTTILFQDNALIGGDITTAFPLSASDPLTSVINAPFNLLTISGAAANNGSYTPLFLQENFNSATDTLTLSGTINGCPRCGNLPGMLVNSNLVTIQFSTDLTGDTSGASESDFVLNNPSAADIVSVTVSPTLLADLGMTGTAFNLTDLDLVGQAVSTRGNSFVVVQNGTIRLNSAGDPPPSVPEPATWQAALLGFGLVIVGSRRLPSRKVG
jgi:hypothetical protein